jgi:hypothetical protein
MRLNIGSRDPGNFDRLSLFKSRYFVGNLYREGITAFPHHTTDRSNSGPGFKDFKLSRLSVVAAGGTKERMHLLRQRKLR